MTSEDLKTKAAGFRAASAKANDRAIMYELAAAIGDGDDRTVAQVPLRLLKAKHRIAIANAIIGAANEMGS